MKAHLNIYPGLEFVNSLGPLKQPTDTIHHITTLKRTFLIHLLPYLCQFRALIKFHLRAECLDFLSLGFFVSLQITACHIIQSLFVLSDAIFLSYLTYNQGRIQAINL